MRITSYQKLILALVISVIVAGCFGYIFWWFFSTVVNARTSLENLRSKISAQEEDKISIRREGRLLEEKKEDIDRIRNFLVEREQPVGFIESLEDLARKTKNTIVMDLDEKQSSIGKNLVFRLTVEGKEESVLKYLELLELLPYQIYLTEVSFQKLPGARGGVTSRIIISIQVRTK